MRHKTQQLGFQCTGTGWGLAAELCYGQHPRTCPLLNIRDLTETFKGEDILFFKRKKHRNGEGYLSTGNKYQENMLEKFKLKSTLYHQ